jgi:hypothetical protein
VAAAEGGPMVILQQSQVLVELSLVDYVEQFSASLAIDQLASADLHVTK